MTADRIQWQSWEITALHEAAHVVVANAFGCPLTRVEMCFSAIAEDGSCEIGGTTYSPLQSRQVELNANGEECWDPNYCFALAIQSLAGFAIEELVIGQAVGSPADERIFSEWMERARLPSNDRPQAREWLGKTAASEVGDSLPKIFAVAGALLGSVDQAMKSGSPLGAWSVAIEGEKLRQLLRGNGPTLTPDRRFAAARSPSRHLR